MNFFNPDILRCGACEQIFFNLDDFVAHKSDNCHPPEGQGSDDSEIEVIRHSPSKNITLKLLLFFVIIVLWFVINIFSFFKGKVKKLAKPTKKSYNEYDRDRHSFYGHKNKSKHSDYYLSRKVIFLLC